MPRETASIRLQPGAAAELQAYRHNAPACQSGTERITGGHSSFGAALRPTHRSWSTSASDVDHPGVRKLTTAKLWLSQAAHLCMRRRGAGGRAAAAAAMAPGGVTAAPALPPAV